MQPPTQAFGLGLARALITVSLTLAAGCGTQSEDKGTETHWLDSCTRDLDCGSLECHCGVCTRSCELASECPSRAPQCVATGSLAAASSCNDQARVCSANAARDQGADSANTASTAAEDAAVMTLGPAPTSTEPTSTPSPTPPTSDSETSDAPTSFNPNPLPDAGPGATDSTQQVNDSGTGSLAFGLVPVKDDHPGVCNTAGWCWQNPTPTGDSFSALSHDGALAAGERGIIFAWPDRYLESPTTDRLETIESIGDEIWTGGQYGLWHYDGKSWSLQVAQQVTPFRRTPDGQLWTMIANQLATLSDGIWDFRQPPLGMNETVLDFAATDATPWVLTTNYRPKEQPKGTLGVWTSSDGDWVFTPSDLVDEGQGWRLTALGDKVYVDTSYLQPLYEVTNGWQPVADKPATSSNGLWLAPDGRFMTSTADGMYAFDAHGAQQVSNVGCGMLVNVGNERLRCTAGSRGLLDLQLTTHFVPETPSETKLDPKLFGTIPTRLWAGDESAWATSATDVWKGPLQHFDGESWTSYADAAPDNFYAAQIDGSASDDVWFIGQYFDGDTGSRYGLLHFDGESIEQVEPPALDPIQFLLAVRSFAPNDTWIAQGSQGKGRILHFDGIEWHEEFTLAQPTVYATIRGEDPTSVRFSMQATMYHQADGQWSELWTAPATSIGASVSIGDELWLVADQVYQLVGDTVTPKGPISDYASDLGLTSDRVYLFSGPNYKTLER